MRIILLTTFLAVVSADYYDDYDDEYESETVFDRDSGSYFKILNKF